jgi:hypothetical protein
MVQFHDDDDDNTASAVPTGEGDPASAVRLDDDDDNTASAVPTGDGDPASMVQFDDDHDDVPALTVSFDDDNDDDVPASAVSIGDGNRTSVNSINCTLKPSSDQSQSTDRSCPELISVTRDIGETG